MISFSKWIDAWHFVYLTTNLTLENHWGILLSQGDGPLPKRLSKNPLFFFFSLPPKKSFMSSLVTLLRSSKSFSGFFLLVASSIVSKFLVKNPNIVFPFLTMTVKSVCLPEAPKIASFIFFYKSLPPVQGPWCQIIFICIKKRINLGYGFKPPFTHLPGHFVLCK